MEILVLVRGFKPYTAKLQLYGKIAQKLKWSLRYGKIALPYEKKCRAEENFDIRFSLRFCHKGNRMAERLLPAHYFEKKAPAARILTGFFTKITCIFQISAPAARKNVFADPLKLI